MNKLSGRTLVALMTCLLLTALVGCRAQSRERENNTPVAVTQVPPTPDNLPVILDPPVQGSIPHDTEAFTQGLLFLDGEIYEATGRNGESRVHALDPENGEIQVEIEIPEQYFGEGLAFLDGQFYQLTWTSGVCFVYNRELEFQKQLLYGTEGWGLTVDPQSKLLVFSDGSSTIRFLNPENLVTERRIQVTDGLGREVRQLNELEWVKGELWANVWMSDVICRIDPATGKTLGWIKFKDLVQKNQTSHEDVLNGLAYDEASDTLWVTGKLWPHLYKIEKVQDTFFKPPDKPQSGTPTPAH